MNQYNYVGYVPADDFNRRYYRSQAEKKGIRLIGIVSGICILAYVVLENILSLPLYIGRFSVLYNSVPELEQISTILLSIFGLLLPFALGGIYLRKRTGIETFPMTKPRDPAQSVFAICLGFFICLIGSYVSSWIVTISEHGGFKLTYPEFDVPSTVFGRILYIIAIAVVPPLAEETAIRGVVMQPLRKYGNVFAIVMSSFVFALLHGNLVQAPFALIAGIGLGYVAVVTESLLPGMIIHLLNNMLSVAVEFLVEDAPSDAVADRIYLIMMIALYAITILGSVMFVAFRGKERIPKGVTALTAAGKTKAFMLNVPMVIAILVMLWVTSNFVSYVR